MGRAYRRCRPRGIYPSPPSWFVEGSELQAEPFFSFWRIRFERRGSPTLKPEPSGRRFYEGFQLGFIITHDEATDARIWKTFSMNKTTIYFNYAIIDTDHGTIEFAINEQEVLV